MELTVDWNAVCLVCLQEGEMRSIFEKDDSDLTICEQIIRCTNIEIHKNMNLPEQICNNCYDDLKIAYRFRKNCESSNIVLKSFIKVGSNVINVDIPNKNGEVYKFKPPSGLNVRRIKVAPRFEVKEEKIVVDTVEYSSDYDQELIESYGNENDGDDDTIETIIEEQRSDVETNSPKDNNVVTLIVTRKEKMENNKFMSNKAEFEKVFTESEDGEVFEQYHQEDEEIGEVEQEQYDEKEDNKLIITEIQTNGQKRRGRPRTKLIKSDIEVTPDNVSSMVSKLSSVAYMKKQKHDPKPLKICELCGNGYKYQHALDSHMRRHRNEKPFACEFCDRAFVANVELRRHMRVHTGQKPYACRYCPRCFSDFGSRIKHERTHTGERPYECATCGKAFAYAHVLSVHVLTHTGEKKFKCDICGKGFTKKLYLQGHMTNTHYGETKKEIIHEIQILPDKTEPEEIVDFQIEDELQKVEYIQDDDDDE